MREGVRFIPFNVYVVLTNSLSDNDPRGPSILLATFAARDKAVLANERIRMHMFKEVISHLEHAGALLYPNSLQERGRAT